MSAVGRPDRVPVEVAVVGEATRLAASPARGDRPEVALPAVAQAPERDARARSATSSAAPRPAPRDVRRRFSPRRDVDGSTSAPRRVAAVGPSGWITPVLKTTICRAVRRPGRVVAEVGQAPHRLAGRAHDEDAAAVALGAEGDLRAVGREGGLGVVVGRVRGQVDRRCAPPTRCR